MIRKNLVFVWKIFSLISKMSSLLRKVSYFIPRVCSLIWELPSSLSWMRTVYEGLFCRVSCPFLICLRLCLSTRPQRNRGSKASHLFSRVSHFHRHIVGQLYMLHANDYEKFHSYFWISCNSSICSTSYSEKTALANTWTVVLLDLMSVWPLGLKCERRRHFCDLCQLLLDDRLDFLGS